jgi:hypothetical protein
LTHKCFNDHSVAQWYTATVNKIDKLHVEPLKVKYEVHYDETEINELYSMNLLMDLILYKTKEKVQDKIHIIQNSSPRYLANIVKEEIHK